MPELMQLTIDRSRRLRRQQTDAERRFWRELRLRQFSGCKFRRQHPVGKYIVDFACVEVGVCIELDGGQDADAVRYDELRSAYIQARGFEVLRFWDNDVLVQTESVKQAIWNALQNRKPPPPCPSP